MLDILSKSLKFIKFKKDMKQLFRLFFYKPLLCTSGIILLFAFFNVINPLIYFITFIAFFCLFLFMFYFFGGSIAKDLHGGNE